MSERAKQIADAGQRLQVHWQPTEWQALERGLAAKLARRARRKRASRLGALAVLVLAGLTWGLSGGHFPLIGKRAVPVARGDAAAQSNPAALRLHDGSQLEASPGADWLERAAASADAHAVELEVLRGRLRLSVVPHGPGEFRVRAGTVLVEVIGTVLTVERNGGDVSVSVEHGRVKVTRGAETPTFLGQGERRSFTALSGDPEALGTPDGVASATVPEVPVPVPLAGTTSGKPGSAPAPDNSWQALARDGEYAAAYGKLHLGAVADVPGDLLLAADVARLSGHPAQAVAPLRRVTREHATDSRAPLAAFTLGRVYLEDLSNPRDAAQAFRLTRTLQPGGPLLELALAREVEAWARAGETQRAKELAREYLQRFPNGTKRKLVQRHADEP